MGVCFVFVLIVENRRREEGGGGKWERTGRGKEEVCSVMDTNSMGFLTGGCRSLRRFGALRVSRQLRQSIRCAGSSVRFFAGSGNLLRGGRTGEKKRWNLVVQAAS